MEIHLARNYFVLVIFLAFYNLYGQSCEDGYSPYSSYKHPKIGICKEVSSDSHSYLFNCEKSNSKFEIWDDTDANRFSKVSLNGKEFPLVSTYYRIGNVDTYEFDINGDSKPDFINVHYLGGNGCASDNCAIFFATSKGNGYVVDSIFSSGFKKEDVVLIDGNVRIVQYDLFSAHQHSFWVFRLLKIQNGKINVDSSKVYKWVKYTDRIQNKETNILNKQQKDSVIETYDWPIFLKGG